MQTERIIEQWIASAGREWKGSTLRHFDGTMRRWFSQEPIETWTWRDIAAWLNRMRSLSPRPAEKSLQNYLAVLSTFYAWCQLEGLREDNPVALLPTKKRAHVRREQKFVPSPDDLRQALALASIGGRVLSTEDRAIISVLCCTGERVGAIADLNRKDVHRVTNLIHFQHTKGDRPHDIPMIPALKTKLEAYLSGIPPGEGPLFPCRSNGTQAESTGRRRRDHIERLVRSVSRELGWAKRMDARGREATPHSIRRAVATAITQSAGLRVAQHTLGHASQSTTEQAYAYDAPNMGRIATAIGQIFG